MKILYYSVTKICGTTRDRTGHGELVQKNFSGVKPANLHHRSPEKKSTGNIRYNIFLLRRNNQRPFACRHKLADCTAGKLFARMREIELQ